MQGTTPRKLALTCALGVVIGIFPIWGTTTWICLGIALAFRLNIVVMQLVNYIFFPAQLFLIFPFINAGAWVFNLKPFPFTGEELIQKFRTDFLYVVKEFGLALSAGIGVWAAVAIPIFLIVFYVSYFAFNRWVVMPNEN